MSQTFLVPVRGGRQPALSFPGRCAGCAAVPDAESTLVIARRVVHGEQQVPVRFRYQVPHCRRCARATRAVVLAGVIPYLMGFIGAAVVVFLNVSGSGSGLDAAGRPGAAYSWLVASAAALAGGLAAGLGFELAARAVLWPVFGRGLFEAPLLARRLVDDADHVAGLTGRPNRDASHLWLTFRNDQVAREFAVLNGRALAGGA